MALHTFYQYAFKLFKENGVRCISISDIKQLAKEKSLPYIPQQPGKKKLVQQSVNLFIEEVKLLIAQTKLVSARTTGKTKKVLREQKLSVKFAALKLSPCSAKTVNGISFSP